MLFAKINQLIPVEIKMPESEEDLEIYNIYYNHVSGWRQKIIDWALAKLPKSVIIDDGEVFFTRSSIRNALAHGKGKLKLFSIPYIPLMLKDGILFYKEKEDKFIYYNYTHPFLFNG